MSIVISSKVRLIIADADSTILDFATNKATELSTLKGIKIDRSTKSVQSSKSRVSATSSKVATVINTGYSEVSLSFSTYIKPITDLGNVSSAEKLLWESLSSTDVEDLPGGSLVAFTSGNVNTSRELYFYLLFDNGTYYKVKRGVVSSVTLDLNIKTITKADWKIQAQDLEYVSLAPLTLNVKDATDEVYIRNKLSTLALNLGGIDYTVAIVSATFSIKNTVVPITRVRVGEIQTVTGHYVADRKSELHLQFYLNDQPDGSSDLQTAIQNYSTLDELNSTTALTLSVGGAGNDLSVNIAIPNGKIMLKSPTVGLFNTVDITVFPQESVVGLGDEVTLIYDNN